MVDLVKDPTPLSSTELDNLHARLHAGSVFDRRGWQIRGALYAERMRLFPRLIVTIDDLLRQLAEAHDRVSQLERRPPADVQAWCANCTERLNPGDLATSLELEGASLLCSLCRSAVRP
jgi:hypothetical protein